MVTLAFIALGFLIGNLVGLTSDSVVGGVVALLFAFGGGSAIGFLTKLRGRDRIEAAKATLGLALSCLIGIYTGILVSEFQLLSTPRNKVPCVSSGEVPPEAVGAADEIALRKYLRSHAVLNALAIDQQRRNDLLTCEQAFQELLKIVREEQVP